MLSEDENAFDFLWSQPIQKAAKRKRSADSDGSPSVSDSGGGGNPNTKLKSKGGAQKKNKTRSSASSTPLAERSGGRRSSTDDTTNIRASPSAASTLTPSPGMSWKQRQKQVQAVHAARLAVLQATDIIHKLSDPLLVMTLTLVKHRAVTKKLSDALTPTRVQLLTAGDTLDAFTLAGSGTDDGAAKIPARAAGEVGEPDGIAVLKQLREYEGYLTVAEQLVAALQNPEASADSVSEAMDACASAKIVVAGCVRHHVLKLGANKFFDAGDFAAWAALLNFEDLVDAPAAAGSKYNIHWACQGNREQATALQDWHIVNKVVESMRSIDTRDEATALARVGDFAGSLGAIPILGAQLMTEVKDLTDLCAVLTSDGAILADAQVIDAATVAQQAICGASSGQHRFHKSIRLLPGGTLVCSRLDAARLQIERDAKAEACMGKAITIISGESEKEGDAVTMNYKRIEKEKDGDAITIGADLKAKAEDLRTSISSVLAKSSAAFQARHADDIKAVNAVFDRLTKQLKHRLMQHNSAMARPAIASINEHAGFGAKTAKSDCTVAEAIAEALPKLKTTKTLGFNSFLDEAACQDIDQMVTRQGALLGFLAAHAGVLVDKIDLSGKGTHELIETLSTWKDGMPECMLLIYLKTFHDGVVQMVQRSVGATVAAGVEGYAAFAAKMATTLTAKSKPKPTDLSNAVKSLFTRELVGDVADMDTEVAGDAPVFKLLRDISRLTGTAFTVTLPPSPGSQDKGMDVPFYMAAVAEAMLQLGQHYVHTVDIADKAVTLRSLADVDLNQDSLLNDFDGIVPVGASSSLAAAVKAPSTHATSDAQCKVIKGMNVYETCACLIYVAGDLGYQTCRGNGRNKRQSQTQHQGSLKSRSSPFVVTCCRMLPSLLGGPAEHKRTINNCARRP
jgi:hypothetical protein